MNRLLIWVETFALMAAYAFSILAVDELVIDPLVRSPTLSIALSFSIVQAAAIAALLAALFVRKSLASWRAQRSAKMRDEMQQALALEAAGQDQLRNLRSLMKHSRRDVEQGIAEFLAAIRGPASDRIAALAKNLGMGVPDDADRLERLFATAANGNLLVRARTIEELEPDAFRLAEGQIAKALTSSDDSRVRAALDMLRSWKRVLPVRHVEALLHHDDAGIRQRALGALPWVESIDGERTVRIGLRDSDRRVRVAAAQAAVRMQIEDAVPQLAENLAGGDREVSLACAFALAALPGGAAVLEKALLSQNRAAASVAFEALEKAAMQRLELA